MGYGDGVSCQHKAFFFWEMLLCFPIAHITTNSIDILVLESIQDGGIYQVAGMNDRIAVVKSQSALVLKRRTRIVQVGIGEDPDSNHF